MSGHLEVELEYPISLDAVLQVQINYDNLKILLDFILQQLKKHGNAFNNLGGLEEKLKDLIEQKLQQQSNKIKSNKEKSKLTAQDVDKLKDEVNLLKEQLATIQQQTVKELEQKLDQKLENIEKDVKALKEEGGGNESDLIGRMDNLEVKCSDYEQRIESLEETRQNHEERIEYLENGQRFGQQQNILSPQSFDQMLEETGDKSIFDSPDKPYINVDNLSDNVQDSIKEIVRQLNNNIWKTEKNTSKIETMNERIGKQDDKFKDHHQKIVKLQNQLNELSAQITGFTTQTTVHTDRFTKITEQIQYLEDNLQSKVDSGDFDQFRQLTLSQGQGVEGSSVVQNFISTTDSNIIKDLKRKVQNIEKILENQGSQGLLSDIVKRLAQLESKINDKADSQQFQELQDFLTKLKQEIDQLYRMISTIDQTQANQENSSSNNQQDNQRFTSIVRRLSMLEETLQNLNIPQGFDLTALQKTVELLKKELEELKDKLDKLWREFYSRFNELEKSIQSNSSFEEQLKELENKIIQMIQNLQNQLNERFADRVQTKRALKYFQKQFQELQTQKPQNQEDAMFARKPLGGWSCASCESNLENLMGRKAGHISWNKLPQRDPADRMSRAGPGYSRMLATVENSRNKSQTVRSEYNSSTIREEETVTVGSVVLPSVAKKNENL